MINVIESENLLPTVREVGKKLVDGMTQLQVSQNWSSAVACLLPPANEITGK